MALPGLGVRSLPKILLGPVRFKSLTFVASSAKFFSLQPVDKACDGFDVKTLLPQSIRDNYNINHPPLGALTGVSFTLAPEGTMAEVDAYYRGSLKDCLSIKTLLDNIKQDPDTVGKRHVNEDRVFLTVTGCNTENGPILQRYLVIDYPTEFEKGCLFGARLKRQAALVYFLSELELREFQIKTDVSTEDGRSCLVRRFVQGQDLGSFLESGQELREVARRVGEEDLCRNMIGSLMIAALDQHNPKNVVVTDDSKVTESGVVGFDYELAMPNKALQRWFDRARGVSEMDDPIFSFEWREKKSAEKGAYAFAHEQLGTGNPWFLLWRAFHDGNDDACLNYVIPAQLLQSMVDKGDVLNKIVKNFQLLSPEEQKQATFNRYLCYFKSCLEQDKRVTIKGLIAGGVVDK